MTDAPPSDEELSEIFSEAYDSEVKPGPVIRGMQSRLEGPRCDEAGYRALWLAGYEAGEARDELDEADDLLRPYFFPIPGSTFAVPDKPLSLSEQRAFAVRHLEQTIEHLRASLAREPPEPETTGIAKLLMEARAELAEANKLLQAERGKAGVDVDRIAERALFALHIYPNYRVDSRGPTGLLLDILDECRPDIAKELRDTGRPSELHSRHFGEAPFDDEDAYLSGQKASPQPEPAEAGKEGGELNESAFTAVHYVGDGKFVKEEPCKRCGHPYHDDRASHCNVMVGGTGPLRCTCTGSRKPEPKCPTCVGWRWVWESRNGEQYRVKCPDCTGKKEKPMNCHNPELDPRRPAFLCAEHRLLLAKSPDEELTIGHFGTERCAVCKAAPTTYHWLKPKEEAPRTGEPGKGATTTTGPTEVRDAETAADEGAAETTAGAGHPVERLTREELAHGRRLLEPTGGDDVAAAEWLTEHVAALLDAAERDIDRAEKEQPSSNPGEFEAAQEKLLAASEESLKTWEKYGSTGPDARASIWALVKYLRAERAARKGTP